MNLQFDFSRREMPEGLYSDALESKTEEECKMSATATKQGWFEGELNNSKYKLPIYIMNGHSYVLDSVETSKLEVDKEAQPRKKDDTQVAYLAASIKKKVLMQPLLVRYDRN